MNFKLAIKSCWWKRYEMLIIHTTWREIKCMLHSRVNMNSQSKTEQWQIRNSQALTGKLLACGSKDVCPLVTYRVTYPLPSSLTYIAFLKQYFQNWTELMDWIFWNQKALLKFTIGEQRKSVHLIYTLMYKLKCSKTIYSIMYYLWFVICLFQLS